MKTLIVGSMLAFCPQERLGWSKALIISQFHLIQHFSQLF